MCVSCNKSDKLYVFIDMEFNFLCWYILVTHLILSILSVGSEVDTSDSTDVSYASNINIVSNEMTSLQ